MQLFQEGIKGKKIIFRAKEKNFFPFALME